MSSFGFFWIVFNLLIPACKLLSLSQEKPTRTVFQADLDIEPAMFFKNYFHLLNAKKREIKREMRRAHRMCSQVQNLLNIQHQAVSDRNGNSPHFFVPTIDVLDVQPLEGNEGLSRVDLRCIKPDDPLHNYWLRVRLMGNEILSISIAQSA